MKKRIHSIVFILGSCHVAYLHSVTTFLAGFVYYLGTERCWLYRKNHYLVFVLKCLPVTGRAIMKCKILRCFKSLDSKNPDRPSLLSLCS